MRDQQRARHRSVLPHGLVEPIAHQCAPPGPEVDQQQLAAALDEDVAAEPDPPEGRARLRGTGRRRQRRVRGEMIADPVPARVRPAHAGTRAADRMMGRGGGPRNGGPRNGGPRSRGSGSRRPRRGLRRRGSLRGRYAGLQREGGGFRRRGMRGEPAEPPRDRVADEVVDVARLPEPDFVLGRVHVHVHRSGIDAEVQHERGIARARERIAEADADGVPHDVVAHAAPVHEQELEVRAGTGHVRRSQEPA